MTDVSRYHPLLVVLHWLVAILILGALGVGFFLLAGMPNTDPQKVDILRIHMAVGMGILLLMLIRLTARLATSRPKNATTGSPTLDRLARLTHWGFYLVVLLMIGTGYATGLLAGLPAIVFGHSGDPLPKSFDVFPTFQAHATLALVLSAMIIVHVAAALYHQVVRKDGLLSRMAFGRR